MNTSSAPITTSNTNVDDEIDLKQLFYNIYAIRWKLVLFTLLFFMIGGIYLFSTFGPQKAQISYVVALDEIKDSESINNKSTKQYPNGMQFSLDHLVLPAIVNKTMTELGIDVEYRSFLKSIQITYYNPNTVLLNQAYSKLASEKSKDVTALNALQKSLNNQQDGKNSVKIMINPTTIGITEKQAQTLLLALVENWSDFFVKRGATAGGEIEQLPKLKYKKGENIELNYYFLITIQENIERAKNILQKLLKANDERKYYSTNDAIHSLQEQVDSLKKNYVDALFSSLSLKESENSEPSFVGNYLLLESKKETLKGLTQSLEDLSDMIRIELKLKEGLVVNSSNKLPLEMDITNLLTIGKKLSLTDTYRELLHRKLKLEQEIAELSRNESNLHNQLLITSKRNYLSTANVDIQFITFFMQQYSTLHYNIDQKVKEYQEYFSNPNTHVLYSASYQPYAESSIPPTKSIIAVIAICLFLSIATMIVLLLAKPSKRED